MKKLVFLFLFFVAGCASDRIFYESTSATWDAVSPEYIEYVQGDPSLSGDDKSMRLRTVETFNRVLEEKAKEFE